MEISGYKNQGAPMRNNIGSEDKLNTLFEIYYPLLNNAWFSQLEPVCHATKLPAMGSVFPSALPLLHVAALSSRHHDSGHPRAMLSLFPAWSPSLPAPAAVRPSALLPGEHSSPARALFPGHAPPAPHVFPCPGCPLSAKSPWAELPPDGSRVQLGLGRDRSPWQKLSGRRTGFLPITETSKCEQAHRTLLTSVLIYLCHFTQLCIPTSVFLFMISV